MPRTRTATHLQRPRQIAHTRQRRTDTLLYHGGCARFRHGPPARTQRTLVRHLPAAQSTRPDSFAIPAAQPPNQTDTGVHQRLTTGRLSSPSTMKPPPIQIVGALQQQLLTGKPRNLHTVRMARKNRQWTQESYPVHGNSPPGHTPSAPTTGTVT